jgi:hypothetical protein
LVDWAAYPNVVLPGDDFAYSEGMDAIMSPAGAFNSTCVFGCEGI